MVVCRPSSDKLTAKDLQVKFTVKGVDLGRTPLQFIAAQKSGAQISSAPRDIQVFPPLRLEPRNITLMIGATIQVRDVLVSTAPVDTPPPPPLFPTQIVVFNLHVLRFEHLTL